MTIDESKIIEEVDEGKALACLLADDILFLNNLEAGVYKGKKYFTTCLYVNLNDVFAWACADAECVSSNDGENPSEVIELYKYWKENKNWGAVKWAAIKRKVQPQRPVIEIMKKSGYWDEVLESLPKNPDSIKEVVV